MTEAAMRKLLRQVAKDWGYRGLERAWQVPRMTIWRSANTDDPIDPRLLPWLGVTLVQTGTVDEAFLAASTVQEEEK